MLMDLQERTPRPALILHMWLGFDSIVSDDYGPSEAASFPYLYSIGAGGSFSGSVQEASLVSPAISVPESEFPSSHLRCGCAGTTTISKETCRRGPDGRGRWRRLGTCEPWLVFRNYVDLCIILLCLTNLDGMPVWTDESCGDKTSPRMKYRWRNGQVVMSDSNSLLPTSMVIHTQVNKHGSLTMWELGKGISAALRLDKSAN